MKEYLYMKKGTTTTYVVSYQLGAYYVSKMFKTGRSTMLVPFNRKYKTVSGASKYLENITLKNPDGSEPELFYATEKDIKRGAYKKGGQADAKD